jgi:hypothetical protein
MTRASKPITFTDPVAMQEGEMETETIYTRVYSTISPPEDATTADQMRLVESSDVLAFWNDPAEDVYSEDDNAL